MDIIDKIRSIKDLTYTGGCSEEQIKEAEDKLGLKFPTEYREILKAFGRMDINKVYMGWTGLNVDSNLNVVDVTLEERDFNINIPKKHFVLSRSTGPDHSAFNSCTLVNEAGEVFDLTDGELDKICDSISDYLDMILRGSGYYA